ncbi:hypothetical protein [Burkholderia anthina]|uniref:hypothetical protein n=1 Tax=Burkholderia anthina TaxID=179879 RepID=UPI001E2C0397|nr:hypothetical protein [Burkholderia anthina]
MAVRCLQRNAPLRKLPAQHAFVVALRYHGQQRGVRETPSRRLDLRHHIGEPRWRIGQQPHRPIVAPDRGAPALTREQRGGVGPDDDDHVEFARGAADILHGGFGGSRCRTPALVPCNKPQRERDSRSNA